MKRLLLVLLAVLAVCAAPVWAAVPQTITVDGINDFDPSNALDDDTADTQSNCTPVVYPMDLGKVFMTNDANFLYIGIQFTKSCYCDMNLGMAFDMNTAGGGTTDPFGRKIGWANVPFKPDWVIYDVTPTTCNSFNYEVLYRDTLGAWVNRSTLINPSWGGGSNGLGIFDSTTFRELKIPLSVLGATTGMPMHVEFWVTQDSPTKGPLDALFSDAVQMSHPNTTSYDTTAVVQMTAMGTYTVQNAIDNAPPTVAGAQAVNFAVQANRQFALLTNKVDLSFSEPVDLTTAQTNGNYSFQGPLTRTIISAVRDVAAANVVHLTLNSPINANAGMYSIVVSNVKDPANNVIVANGSTNKGSFYIQNLVFNGDMRVGLCNGNFTVADTFAVEGSIVPLSFGLCDNALMTDANADSIYTTTVPFCLQVPTGGTTGEADLGWKFSRICSQYEPLGSNRDYHLTSANGATATINAAWNNDDPANFAAHAIDVIFKVDATRKNPLPGDVITLLGNTNPLHFTQPGAPMLDNGVAPDAVAGDKIYTALVHFPACSPKNVSWKVDFNGVIECAGQGDRTVYLNDQLYSVANPIVLPARGIDRCEVTDKPLTVVFKLNADHFSPLPGAADSTAVMGSSAPLSWTSRDPQVLLRNDGVGYDAVAGDVFYTRAITFPDSTRFQVNFKYWNNGLLECDQIPDRTFTLDDVNYSSGTPIVRIANIWDFCTEATGVSGDAPAQGAGFALLRPVMPNPVTHRANISFDLRRAGHVTLSIYDVGGRRVARLLNETRAAGQHSVSWDGMGDNGLRLSSGVYMYELAMGRDHVTRRLILTH